MNHSSCRSPVRARRRARQKDSADPRLRRRPAGDTQVIVRMHLALEVLAFGRVLDLPLAIERRADRIGKRATRVVDVSDDG